MTISLTLPENLLVDLANRYLSHQDNSLRLEAISFADQNATIVTNRGTFEVSGISILGGRIELHSVRTIISILGFKQTLPSAVQQAAFNALNRSANIHISGQQIEIDLTQWWPPWLPASAYQVEFKPEAILLRET